MRKKFNPQLKNFLTNLRKALTMNYIAICVTVRFLATNAFLLIPGITKQNRDAKLQKLRVSCRGYLRNRKLAQNVSGNATFLRFG